MNPIIATYTKKNMDVISERDWKEIRKRRKTVIEP